MAARFLALACVAVAVFLPSVAGAAPGSIVTITSGPAEGETVSSESATFTFESSVDATFQCTLDGGAAENCDSGRMAYSNLANGQHTFDVIATTTGPDTVSGSEKRTWTVAVAPVATITEQPPDPSESTDATFSFTSDQSGVFECSLDGAAPEQCSSPKTYHGLSEQQHVFAVRAVGPTDATGPADEYRWEVKAPPPAEELETTIVAGPSRTSASHDATFSFSANVADATFQCSLDGKSPEHCTSPVTYSGLDSGDHSFHVAASSGDRTDESPAEYSWTVAAPLALDTTITSKPSDPSSSSEATFEFTSNRDDATFECSLDRAGFTACTSPSAYKGLSDGAHAFDVRAVRGGALDTSPAHDEWTVEASSSSTPWVWIIVGIAAAVAIAAGVYYFFWYRKRGGPPGETPPDTPPTDGPPPDAAPTEVFPPEPPPPPADR